MQRSWLAGLPWLSWNLRDTGQATLAYFWGLNQALFLVTQEVARGLLPERSARFTRGPPQNQIKAALLTLSDETRFG
jgi:hypothetical protein